MFFRAITNDDIPELFKVRAATDENRLTIEELHNLGITPDTVQEKLDTTYRGWLCEEDGQVVGFAMGDKATGEIWVIAVLPAYTKRGIGSKLFSLVENWLWDSGCTQLWLTTDVDTTLRAYSFYIHRGWQDDQIENGLRIMVKPKPNSRV